MEKIVHLRRHYHFGPAKIVMYLARYHDVTISVSGVWRILKRLGLNRLPASQRYQRHDRRWKRYEKAQPGHRVQIDVKFIEALPGAEAAATRRSDGHIVETTGLAARRRRRYYQFTAIDDCTRLRVLKVYPKADQKTAIAFLDHVLGRLPFRVEVIQTDNGAKFQSAFHWRALDQGLQHVYIKPRTPRLNGKVERSHRIDAEEFYRLLDGVVIDDSQCFDDKLREWEDYYNYHRPATAPTAAKPPMRGSARRPPSRPRRNRPPSVAQGQDRRRGRTATRGRRDQLHGSVHRLGVPPRRGGTCPSGHARPSRRRGARYTRGRNAAAPASRPPPRRHGDPGART